MSGEIVLGRGEFDIAIATGRPPSQVSVMAKGASPVVLEVPRILGDGFAFRARVAGAPCRICYQYVP
jgi:hypothetical protein